MAVSLFEWKTHKTSVCPCWFLYDSLLKKLFQKDPNFVKDVEEQMQRLVKGGAGKREIGFEITRLSDGTVSAQLKEIGKAKKLGLSLSQDFVGAKKFTEGEIKIHADYDPNAPPSEHESSNSSPSLSDSADLDKSFVVIQREAPMVLEDYLSSELYENNLNSANHPDHPRQKPNRVHRTRHSEIESAVWNYRDMKSIIAGYFPRSYISALRVLAEFPNSYYVTFSLEKITEWLNKKQ